MLIPTTAYKPHVETTQEELKNKMYEQFQAFNTFVLCLLIYIHKWRHYFCFNDKVSSSILLISPWRWVTLIVMLSEEEVVDVIAKMLQVFSPESKVCPHVSSSHWHD